MALVPPLPYQCHSNTINACGKLHYHANASHSNNHANSNGDDSNESENARPKDITDSPKLKAKILKVFKLTHPDLFSQYPEEQKTNQRSLQLFQNFLDEYRGYASPGMNSGLGDFDRSKFFTTRYQLEFFLKAPKRKRDEDADDDKDERVDNTKFRKVAVNLRGPPNGCGVVEKSRKLLYNMRLLFAAIDNKPIASNAEGSGIDPHDFSTGMEMEDDDDNDDMVSNADVNEEERSLFHFMVRNKHNIEKHFETKNRLASHQADVQVNLIRHRISDFFHCETLRFEQISNANDQFPHLARLAEYIQERFGVDTSGWGYKEGRSIMAEAIRSGGIASVQGDIDGILYDYVIVKKIRQNVRDLRIFIGPGHSHVHRMGYLCLGTRDRPEDWVTFLTKGFDPQMAHELTERRNRVTRMEKQAAEHLKIGVFACESDEIFAQDRYEELLNDILSSERPSHLDRIEELRIDDYRQWITLIICEDITNIGDLYGNDNHANRKKGRGKNVHIHQRFGFLLADVNSTSAQIHAKISVHGAQAGYKLNQHQNSMAEIVKQLNKVCRLLKMVHLDFDSSLSLRQVKLCCEQMCAFQQELEPVLRGMHVFIGHAFYIRENGVMEIPYNFKTR